MIANAWPITPDQVTPTHLPMATDRVAFAGEIVAVVVARTAAEARDAAELVDVEYEELPAVLDLKEAAEDKVLAHPDLGTNKTAFWQLDSAGPGHRRRVDEVIAEAQADGIVIEREYRQQRLIPAFMEPRSRGRRPDRRADHHVVGDPDPAHHPVPARRHDRRARVEDPGDRPRRRRRVRRQAADHPEEWIAWAVARKIGKPCKYTETRSESLVCGHHGRDQWQKLTLAATKEGKVTGLKVDLLADMGAYVGVVGGGVPVLGALMYNAIYKFDAYQFNCTPVLTNKTWVDAYRGAGRPEATYAIERIMDELAAEVGKDPLEVREMNWIKHEEFPFTTVAGMTYDSGNYEAATAKAKEMFGYDALRAEQKERRDARRQGPARHRHLDLHRDVRPGAAAGCSAAQLRRRRLGARRPSGCCRPARSR